ncbi:MAG TPA: hypothetical protein VK177_16450 [Flavobacteriales bacterium]|nr:hypothetical protein [Flavobacteriales bacterium]
MEQPFHLGICMAGAVTAGSYTAGAMDYILETMERWQQQKDANKAAAATGAALPYPDTPMHNVVIEIVAGASAGGMCAVITSAMLAEGFTVDELANKKSKMYKAWIELDDEQEEEGTIKKMLDTGDIEKNGIVSLLNSQPLTRISEKAVYNLEQTKLPAYVSKHLDTLLTIANLRGTRYGIEFKTNAGIKKHLMTLHRDFMHFKLNTTAGPTSDFLELNYANALHVDLLRKSAVATGAFPIGLEPRPLTRNARYYYNKADATIGLSDPVMRDTVYVQRGNDNNYHSLNIDGGTFNNEPFGETERILNARAGKKHGEDISYNKTNRTTIMIDPFPSEEDFPDTDDLKTGLNHVAPRIVAALRSQSSFKVPDLIDAYGDNNYLKFLIIPVKSGRKQPLCCATVGAFGGFFYKAFREHDYQLGRRNAQLFLRKHFTMPYSENEENNNAIHRGWSKNMVDKYKDVVDGKTYLPIIPDVRINDAGSEVPSPALPVYPLHKLKELEKPLAKRVDAMLNAAEKFTSGDPEKPKSALAEEWFRKNAAQRFFGSLGGFIGKPFVWIIMRSIKKKIRDAAVKGAVTWIIEDLNDAGLLGDSKFEIHNS